MIYIERNDFGWISIHDINQGEIEVIQTAVLRILNDLPADEQPAFRRLAMDIDKLIKR